MGYPAFYTVGPGTTLSLQAVPEPGYVFSHWEGAVTGNDNPASVYMDCSKTVTAVFVIGFQVSVSVSPANTGTIKVNGNIAGSYPAVYSFAQYATVTLEAVPAAGYIFSNWGGGLTGNANPASIYIDNNKNVTATFKLPVVKRLYFPHVASQVLSTPYLWETEICVVNPVNETISGTLKFYNNSGQQVSTGKVINLAPYARWSRIVGAGEFANPSGIAYMVFESYSDSVVGYTKFYIDGVYRTAIPAVQEGNTSNINIPHIASTADWWTGISLVNTNADAAQQLTITFNNGQSSTFMINANEHKAFDIASLFNNQPQPGIQSGVISGAKGIIGLELFGSRGWGTQLEGILLTDKTASTIYYPHVAGSEWWTGIVAYNPSDLEASITIRPYSSQGSALTTSTLSIAGKGKYVGAVSQLNLPGQTAWFRIDSTRPLSGFELFGTTDGQQLAAYAAGGGTATNSGVFPKIEKSGGWTSIALVNTEGIAASVTLTAYNDSGVPLAIRTMSVPGYAKVVNPVQDLFTQNISGATYIAYESGRNVVGFQLNGSADGKMLDGLPGLGGND